MTTSEHGRGAFSGAQAPTLLALETSTIACSVALSARGRTHEDHRIAPRQHNQLVLQMIDALMKSAQIAPADLDAVAFGCGPGSFTGVRIAAGVAQGISLALDIPVVPVSTLRVLALTASAARTEPCHVLAAIQARADEVYFGGYRCADGGCATLIEETVSQRTALTLPTEVDADWYIVGDGAPFFRDVLAARNLDCRCDVSALPAARALLTLALRELRDGRRVGAAGALPVYLDGTRPWRKRAT